MNHYIQTKMSDSDMLMLQAAYEECMNTTQTVLPSCYTQEAMTLLRAEAKRILLRTTSSTLQAPSAIDISGAQCPKPPSAPHDPHLNHPTSPRGVV
jgi:hypothetical protein